MAGFMSASIWLKIALITLLTGTLLYVIGFATVSWMTLWSARQHWAYGLWEQRACHGGSCGTGAVRYRYSEDWQRATQALEVLGLICNLLALLILLLYMFVDQCRRRNALIATIVFIFAAVFFIVVGIAIFAIKLEERGFSVGWSMGIAIVGAIFMFVAGIMSILHSLGR
ncbi:uncharacterized protein LOC121372276 [Gigantopelta aegis]|uniref:uncharacterized protein LOC121372276 n=1 Tax=Gigantopelta aegis TaxID=1735272 RepID=UPI001B88BB71|nr:uncharacterized protein LOC121372276 [Gigantopelta aegis]